MKDILGKVSNFALQKLSEQGKAALKVPTDEECSGMFECTWILPCKHIIARKIDSGKGIELSDIGQWWLECDSAVADSSDEEAAVELSPRSTARLKYAEKCFTLRSLPQFRFQGKTGGDGCGNGPSAPEPCPSYS
ncbi:hypothetical protein PsorP6_013477 [Peronosclerospora sorghi]|uniref:Uncharacterized protein n=1 Tax=Peronosclerospora sorghi TaxID=230839 RepID=A0ACC0VHY2_9STRA|nr:hypothetical protein PsorP6_013477 [Peronosclerospora sorghi]